MVPISLVKKLSLVGLLVVDIEKKTLIALDSNSWKLLRRFASLLLQNTKISLLILRHNTA